jgi:hypothetical protein
MRRHANDPSVAGQNEVELIEFLMTAAQNKFGVDLAKQQPANTEAWYAPAMYNMVRQNGEDVPIAIKPDKECVVNSGLGSVRGARMAEDELFTRAQYAAATPHRSHGVARPDAADELG